MLVTMMERNWSAPYPSRVTLIPLPSYSTMVNGWTTIANLSVNSSSSSINDTDVKLSADINLAVPLLMFACGVFGNALALILLFCSCRKHSRSVFYHLVAGLALTDLVGIVATSPVTILVYSNDRKWVGGQPVCDYFSFMMIWAGLATVLVVGAMTLERVLAILHPYFYERHVTATKVKAGIAVIWLVSVLISCLPLVKVGTNKNHFPGTWCFFDFYSHAARDQAFSIFYAIIGLLVILLTAIGNCAVSWAVLRMKPTPGNVGHSRSGRTLRKMASEFYMICFLIVMLVVFAVCYLPLMVRVLLNSCGWTKENRSMDLLSIRLASLNQILDPWVYLLFRRRLATKIYSCFRRMNIVQFQTSIRKLRSEYNSSPRNSPALVRLQSFTALANGDSPRRLMSTNGNNGSPNTARTNNNYNNANSPRDSPLLSGTPTVDLLVLMSDRENAPLCENDLTGPPSELLELDTSTTLPGDKFSCGNFSQNDNDNSSGSFSQKDEPLLGNFCQNDDVLGDYFSQNDKQLSGDFSQNGGELLVGNFSLKDEPMLGKLSQNDDTRLGNHLPQSDDEPLSGGGPLPHRSFQSDEISESQKGHHLQNGHLSQTRGHTAASSTKDNVSRNDCLCQTDGHTKQTHSASQTQGHNPQNCCVTFEGHNPHNCVTSEGHNLQNCCVSKGHNPQNCCVNSESHNPKNCCVSDKVAQTAHCERHTTRESVNGDSRETICPNQNQNLQKDGEPLCLNQNLNQNLQEGGTLFLTQDFNQNHQDGGTLCPNQDFNQNHQEGGTLCPNQDLNQNLQESDCGRAEDFRRMN